MSQNDLDLANASGASFRADANLALQALASRSSGATAPSTTYAHMLWVDTTTGVEKRRNAANSAWIVTQTNDETFVLSRSSNTMLDVSDKGKAVVATGTWSQTFDAVATLGDGWYVDYINDGTGTITLDPNSTEQIDGATTIALQPGEALRIECNGSALKTTRSPFFRYGAAVVQTTGEITFPLQSAFLAYNQATDTNQTGDATSYTVAFDAEVFDQNADYNTGTYTFTAPVTGKYQLSAGVLLNNMGSSHTTITLRIVTSNRTYENTVVFGSNPCTIMTPVLSALADMDAADTATVTVRVSGGTKTVGVFGDTAPTTFFSGYLAC